MLNAIKAGKPVFVVEGEKDADNLALIGCTATTCAIGAGKWHKEHSAFLMGADVYILPDNDIPGKNHAVQVAEQLLNVAKSVRILDLSKACAQLPEKGDISDMIQLMGKTAASGALKLLMARTEAMKPREKSPYEKAVALYEEVDGYGVTDGGVVAYGKDSLRRLTTFVALPEKIITKDDGVTVEKHFQIAGWTKSGHPLPTVTVRTDDFGGMGWVLRNWDFAAQRDAGQYRQGAAALCHDRGGQQERQPRNRVHALGMAENRR